MPANRKTEGKEVFSMSKNPQLLALVEKKTAYVTHAQNQIAGAAARVCPGTEPFVFCTNNQELLKKLTAAFTQTDTVILAVECPLFLQTKNLLFKALGLKREISKDIVQLLSGGDAQAPENGFAGQAEVPKGSSVFLSEDGLYAGFAVVSGKQHLIVLPLDAVRIDAVIANGFFDYLRALYPGGESAPAAAGPAAVTPQAEKACEALKAKNMTVAVASTKTSCFLEAAAKNAPAAGDCLAFVECDVEKGEKTHKEHIAALAFAALKQKGSNLGAAMSNVFVSETDSSKVFVFVAVADAQRTRVAKIFAEPGETPRQLIDVAVESLLDMLADYAERNGFAGFENSAPPAPPAAGSGLLPTAAIALICAAAAALSAAVGWMVR